MSELLTQLARAGKRRVIVMIFRYVLRHGDGVAANPAPSGQKY